ncbi:MAG: Ig-like domain-containing protein [Myxococcaceae bacterium]|nr:Ig-like domain-containing protein [Myxococcaceae bacterium]
MAGGTGGSSATLTAIAIEPTVVSLGVSESQQLTARGTFSDGSQRELTSGVTWSSSAMALVTVTSAGVVTAVAEGTADISATQGGVSGTRSVTVSGQALSSIEVGPSNATLGVGSTTQFFANGTYADGSKRNITAEVTWSSSAPTVARVNASPVGSVTAMASGTATVTASLRGKTADVTTTVGPKTVTSLAVTPPMLAIRVGDNKAMTATATYSDGSTGDVTAGVTWSVDNGSTALTVSGSGVVTGVSSGQSIGVRVALQGLESVARVTVTADPFHLTGLSYTPEPLFKGLTYPEQRVIANFGMISSNSLRVSWTSSDPTILRVDPNRGWEALKVGSVTMTAVIATTDSMLMTSGVVNVLEPVPDTITVASGASGMAVVAPGATLQLVATGVSALFPALNANLTAQVTWASSNPAAVTVDANGLARGVSAGTSTVTATLGSTVGSTVLNVPAVVPPMMTTTLLASEDNSIFSSSITPNSETRVYPTNAFFPEPGIGVGCMWLWNPPIGPAPETFHATCAEGLVAFDLSSLAGKTVLSAKLRLTTSAYGIGSVPRRWSLYAVASPWSGNSVTWAQASGFQYYVNSLTQHDPPTVVGQVYEVDQTTTVKNWLSGAYRNAGFRMNITSYLYPYLRYNSLDPFEFHSREDPGGRGPKLIVTYQ